MLLHYRYMYVGDSVGNRVNKVTFCAVQIPGPGSDQQDDLVLPVGWLSRPRQPDHQPHLCSGGQAGRLPGPTG
jgi:hypothetical protein